MLEYTRIPTQLLTEKATLPTRGSALAAGSDLYADLSTVDKETDKNPSQVGWDADENLVVVLRPGERRLIKTGVALQIPEQYYGRIAPRSGLAYKHGIDVMAGVIDSDYRGEIGVILINHGDIPFVVNHGDRVAQMIFTPYVRGYFEQSALADTDRADGGFGSTGTS